MQNVCGLSKREALRVFGFQVFDVRGLGLTGFTGKPIVWIPIHSVDPRSCYDAGVCRSHKRRQSRPRILLKLQEAPLPAAIPKAGAVPVMQEIPNTGRRGWLGFGFKI